MTADDARLTLAQRELDESARDWLSARLLAREAFYRQAITRLYFATFHTAQALLAAHGVEAATHEGVQRLIGLHLVVPDALPKEAGRALSSLLSRRHEADYRLLVDIDEGTWLAAGSEAITFFGAASVYLRRAWQQLSLPTDLGAQ
jgi:uncharacterized protein (UPF0332 family)